MPAAGIRWGTGVDVDDVGSIGFYWSSTPYGADNAYSLYFYSYDLSPQNYNDRNIGFSVRLVR